MKRILALLLTSVAVPAYGADFTDNAPVTQATIYPQGASLIRTVTVDLPAGQHRILVPALADGSLPRISAPEGIAIGAIETLNGAVTDPETIYSEDQRAAKEQVEELRDALQDAEDTVIIAEGAVAGALQKVEYLKSLSGGALTSMDPASILATSDLIAAELQKAWVAQQQANIAKRDAVEAKENATKALAQAERDLALKFPPTGPVSMTAITLSTAQAGEVELALETLSYNAGWMTSYEMNLDRDGALIEMDRNVVLRQSSGMIWQDVAVTLSTANPFSQVNPTEPWPNLAQISGKGQGKLYSRSAASESFEDQLNGLERTSVAEAAPVLEDTRAGLQIDGLSVTYSYPTPVSLTPDGSSLQLSLDALQFEARAFNRAFPRVDQTAFLMAEFTNATPEPLLPGPVLVSRDGAFVGETAMQLVPAGAETEVSFGPLEGIRLDFKLLENETGDKGFITSSSIREQEMEFSVENLTGEAESIQTLFALPFSEQEDLEVSARAQPTPDTMDFEKKQGVGVWDMNLAPGEKKTVRVTVQMDWPEGQQLIWRP